MAGYSGHQGKILLVDLSSRRTELMRIDRDFMSKYLGGNGFGARLLYDNVPPRADPLGPDNCLIFVAGPAQGTALPGGDRTGVVTKSPLTGGFIDSYFGGHFGAELKYTGLDGLLIKGKAPSPVYLWVRDGVAEIRDAGGAWGLSTFDTQLHLMDALGENTAVASIGPAGEKLVPIACIIAGVNAAGRGGTGAVMGSKNLKAIALRGSRDVRVAQPEGLSQFIRDVVARIKAHPATGKSLPTYGTAASIAANNHLGILGTRNWREEQFEGADFITGTAIKDKGYGRGSIACMACPIACNQLTEVAEGEFKGASTVGPEYETLWAFGATTGNACLESIVYADRLCDEYGIDTISAGATIAFAMECFERGIIGPSDTDGIELRFGDYRAMLKVLEKIVKAEGIGAILGQGSRQAACHFGKGAEEYAMHVKGLEMAAHSARGIFGIALGYSTSNRGGSHQDGRATAERTGLVDREPEGKGRYTASVQRMTALCDCLITCRMTESIYGLTGITGDHTRIVQLITGMEVGIPELVDIADRVYCLERAFNIREGLASRSTDLLPKRLMIEPIPRGPSAGRVVDRDTLDRLLDEYYEERGWDPATGYPSYETLIRLGLPDLAADIWGERG